MVLAINKVQEERVEKMAGKFKYLTVADALSYQ